jgi:hypothetical protein
MIAAGDQERGKALQGKTQQLLLDTYEEDSADYMAAASGERLAPDFDPPAI